MVPRVVSVLFVVLLATISPRSTAQGGGTAHYVGDSVALRDASVRVDRAIMQPAWLGAAPSPRAAGDPQFVMPPGVVLASAVGPLALSPIRAESDAVRDATAFSAEAAPPAAEQTLFHPGALTSMLSTLALAVFFFVRRTR